MRGVELPNYQVDVTLMADEQLLASVLEIILVSEGTAPAWLWWAVGVDVAGVAELQLGQYWDDAADRPGRVLPTADREVSKFMAPVTSAQAATSAYSWLKHVPFGGRGRGPDNDGTVEPCAMRVQSKGWPNVATLITPAWGVWGK